MPVNSFKSNSPEETRRLAASFLREWLGGDCEGALVIALSGELGAGKTTFVQALAREFSIEENVSSPTFVIVKRFSILEKSGDLPDNEFCNLYHIDAYRVSDPQEVIDLGLESIISSEENIVLVEWADNIKPILPEDAIWVIFKCGGYENERLIFVSRP